MKSQSQNGHKPPCKRGHRHHWIVDEHNVGRCLICGQPYQFPQDPLGDSDEYQYRVRKAAIGLARMRKDGVYLMDQQAERDADYRHTIEEVLATCRVAPLIEAQE